MAKKKVTHQDKLPQNQEQTHQTTAMDDASEKLESLKSLNAMLLKETVERRQQVGSLQHSNGCLVTELTRSESEKKAFESELTELNDRTVSLELERNLVFLFVAVQVNQQAEEFERERDGFRREKVEMDKRLENLEREMREVSIEKSEIEKVKREKETEIGLLNKKLSEVLAKIENEKEVSIRVSRERDAVRTELDAHIEETNRLRIKLIETENREKELQNGVKKLKMGYDGVVEEKEERERTIELIMRDRDSIERSLVESNGAIDEMKREIQEMIRKKQVIVEERNMEAMKMIELEKSVDVLQEMVLRFKKEEERLRQNVAVLEKRCVDGEEKEKQMGMEIDGLVEEKKEMEESFQRLIEEKGLVMKELDGVVKQLDEQKQKVEEIVREKVEIEEAKDRKEGEILELQNAVAKLEKATVSLEESCKVQIQKVEELASDNSDYRDGYDLVKTERDEARKAVDEEKMNVMNLKAKILEMEKRIEETHNVLGEMKAENFSLSGEKKELESHRGMLMKEIDLLENKLAEARKEVDDMKAKVGLGNANSELVLNMLRNTVTLVCMSKGEKGVVDESVLVEQKAGEEVKPHAAELEAIKKAFKDRESKVEDMKRQLEFLKSEAEKQKRKSFWTLVSSAATIVAAGSVAYAACGH